MAKSIPYSTYAKVLVDVATAAGQKGGQTFFKNAAQVAIQNAMATLEVLNLGVTIDHCYRLITDREELKDQVDELQRTPHRLQGALLDYYREFMRQPPEQLGGMFSDLVIA